MGTAAWAAPEPEDGPSLPVIGPAASGLVAGQVTGSNEPLEAVRVYAYQLASRSITRVTSDGDGRFLFRELPAGLYKIIAHKSGFLPAVIMLPRKSLGDDQFLDLELLEHTAGASQDLDPWQIRQKIPADILRELGYAEPAQVAAHEPAGTQPAAPLAVDGQQLALETAALRSGLIRAEMQALTGVDDRGFLGPTRLSGGRVDLDTRVGDTQLGLKGTFLQREGDGGPADGLADLARGQQSSLTLELRSRDDARFNVTSQHNRMMTLEEGGGGAPVDFENYQVGYSKPVGHSGHSEIQAQYTTETNFYRLGWLQPRDIPDASRTLSITGSYTTAIGEQATLETELRYRERQGDYFDGQSLEPLSRYVEETVELNGRGGWQVQPTLMVEYGLYTRLRDGSLSLTPRGGLVWQLGQHWQAATEVTKRLYREEDSLYRDFIPAFHHEGSACDRAESACYRIAFTRESDEGDKLTLGAAHREFDETLRLYFDEEFSFLDQLNSLYLVRGDRLPELQLAISRRISPKVLATLESSIASGGGGLIYAVDTGALVGPVPGLEAYENQVRYLVTSLDTQFQHTSTGLFIAFHHLQQDLDAVDDSIRSAGSQTLELERLQFMLTQDLGFLADLAADWAVHLNMELSRGNTPLTGEDAHGLRKRFLGGLAVRF